LTSRSVLQPQMYSFLWETGAATGDHRKVRERKMKRWPPTSEHRRPLAGDVRGPAAQARLRPFRPVALTGTGRVGNIRLLVQVARAARRVFRDEAWFGQRLGDRASSWVTSLRFPPVPARNQPRSGTSPASVPRSPRRAGPRAAAQGARVRFRHDVLASAVGLERGRGLAAAARSAPTAHPTRSTVMPPCIGQRSTRRTGMDITARPPQCVSRCESVREVRWRMSRKASQDAGGQCGSMHDARNRSIRAFASRAEGCAVSVKAWSAPG